MRSAALAVTVGLALVAAGCGADDEPAGARDPTATDPIALTEREVPTSANLDAAGRRRFATGRALAASSGCLACHQIGPKGNDGPGPDLNGIGNRLAAPALRRTLLRPTAPMPSFARLGTRRLRALLTFLSSLRREGIPLDPPPSGYGTITGLNCQQGVDCPDLTVR